MGAAVEAEVEIELLHTDRDRSRRRKKFCIPSYTFVRLTDTRDYIVQPWNALLEFLWIRLTVGR